MYALLSPLPPPLSRWQMGAEVPAQPWLYITGPEIPHCLLLAMHPPGRVRGGPVLVGGS